MRGNEDRKVWEREKERKQRIEGYEQEGKRGLRKESLSKKQRIEKRRRSGNQRWKRE